MDSNSLAGVGLAVTAIAFFKWRRGYSRSAVKRMKGSSFNYPDTMKIPSVQLFHGHEVHENFRWLEDADSPQTKHWVEEQVKCTREYLESNSPYKEVIRQRLNETVKFDLFLPPFRKGNYLFFNRREIKDNQPILYVQDKSLPPFSDTAKVLLDPNSFKADGTASLSTYAISEDGRYIAYGVSYSGSDWITISVKEIATGKVFDDKIEWVKFSGISWSHDNLGFFYCKYPAPASLKDNKDGDKGTETDGASGQGAYYHVLGNKDADKDICVYKDAKNTKWLYGLEVSDDGKYLLITPNDSCDPVNYLFVVDLQNIKKKEDGTYKAVTFVDNQNFGWQYLTNVNQSFYFKTNSAAPKSKIVCVTFPDTSAFENWTYKGKEGECNFTGLKVEDVVKEDEGVLDWVTVCKGEKDQVFILASYMLHVLQEIRVIDLKGKIVGKVPTPTIGTISSWSGNVKYSDAFYSFTSMVHPPAVWHIDISKLINESQRKDGKILSAAEEIKAPFIPGLNSDDFETKQVFFTSKDGTKVPMFVCSKKGRNTPAPIILYGYGGFNISLVPSFSSVRLFWLQHFGNYVIVNLRGGGEYGDAWHNGGKKQNKQNVFDDFIYAAKYLVKENYTEHKLITINGGSNGGLLVAACALQAPELFGCGVSQVPVTDMLRYQKFTIGYAWISDYGDSEEDEAMFKYLFKYSPVHNVKKGMKLPALMITTADHDDRVVPLHSFKLISSLQDIVGRHYNEKPLLIRIETSAGHGAGKPVSKTIDEWVDIYSFIQANIKANFEK